MSFDDVVDLFANAKYGECAFASYQLLNAAPNELVLPLMQLTQISAQRTGPLPIAGPMFIPVQEGSRSFTSSLLALSAGQDALDAVLTLATNDEMVAQVLCYYGMRMMSVGNVQESVSHLTRSLEISRQGVEARLAEIDLQTPSKWSAAVPLLAQAVSLIERGDYTRGLAKAGEARKMAQKEPLTSNRFIANALSLEGVAHEKLHNFELAEECHVAALQISREHALNHPIDLARDLNNLAQVFKMRRERQKAIELLTEAKQYLGSADTSLRLSVIGNLASLEGPSSVEDRHSFDVPADGPDMRAVITSKAHALGRQSNRSVDKGHLGRALSDAQERLSLLRSTLGEDHPEFASALAHVGSLLSELGDTIAGEQMTRQALNLVGQKLGTGHPEFGRLLNSLGVLISESGRSIEAQIYVRRAIQVFRSRLGDENIQTLTAEKNLAALLREAGQPSQAETLLRQIRPLLQTKGDPADVMSVDHSLAHCLFSRGQRDEAKSYFEAVAKQAYEHDGDRSPLFRECCKALAMIAFGKGELSEARNLLESALRSDRLALQDLLASGFQPESRGAYSLIRSDIHMYLTLLIEMDFPSEAMEFAAECVLQFKGANIELNTLRRNRSSHGQAAEAANRLLHDAISIRRTIAQKLLDTDLSSSGIGKVLELAKERKEIESQLEQIRAQSEPCTESILGRVRDALSPDSVIVDFFRTDLVDLTQDSNLTRRDARYLAFLIHPRSSDFSVSVIDAGPAASIDVAIANYRKALTSRASAKRDLAIHPSDTAKTTSADDSLRLLSEAIAKPLMMALGSYEHWYICGDGDLLVFPFDLLQCGDGRILIEAKKTSHLSAVRDFLRPPADTAQATTSIVIADPDFDLVWRASEAEAAVASGIEAELRSSGQPLYALKSDASGQVYFHRLPETEIEARLVQSLVNAELWDRAGALKRRVETLRSPEILHFATHGFVVGDRTASDNLIYTGLDAAYEGGDAISNPLLRSGLALAGANTWLRGGKLSFAADNGILTAEDVSMLSLENTSLVVLSACDTGLGTIRLGEGVFGLRRAFLLAGARAIVMSLWKVPDRPTRELMSIFYRKMSNGSECIEALRSAKLEIRGRYDDPGVWAAFVIEGNPGPSWRPTRARL